MLGVFCVILWLCRPILIIGGHSNGWVWKTAAVNRRRIYLFDPDMIGSLLLKTWHLRAIFLWASHQSSKSNLAILTPI